MKILFTPYGGGSIAHVVRSLAVADELKRRGHQIMFTSPKTKKTFIEKAGYKVFGEGHADVNLNDENDQAITYFRNNHNLFINWLNDEIEAAESFKPAIIVNSPSFFGPLASLKLGIPHVSIMNAQWLLEFKGLLGLGKSKNHLGHYLLRKLAKPIFAKRFDDLYMEEIRNFYHKLKIPTVPEKRIDLHRHNPVLIPSIPDFEPLEKTSRTDFHYIGPLFWRGFEKEKFDPRTIFNNFNKKPFIYVTLGGSIYRKKSYEDLIEALNEKKDWNIILSYGPNFSPTEFKTDRSHLIIKPFVGGLQASKYADVIINTASHGTVMQALWYGKPVVALPHNIDQATIASRLVELGIGVNLNQISLRDFTNREKYFKKATEIPWSKVIKKTDALLNDSKIRNRAKLFKEKLRNYDNAERVSARYIEYYAKQGAR